MTNTQYQIKRKIKRPIIAYWICTGLLVPTLGLGSVNEIMGNPLAYILFPVVILLIVFGSYFLHHKRLKLQKTN